MSLAATFFFLNEDILLGMGSSMKHGTGFLLLSVQLNSSFKTLT